MVKVTLLGTGGTMPLKNRWLSSCLISTNGHSILIDCGEGTQIALKQTENKFKPIDVICITHFHADHISGLPGFLLSMSNEGREEPITIIGVPGLKKVVESLCIIAPNLPFEVNIAEYKSGLQLKLGEVDITPFRAEHSIPCLGYTMQLKRNGRFDTEKAKLNKVPVCLWSTLQKNNNVFFDGIEYTPSMVLGEERKGIKVTYCTDSRPTDNIRLNAENSDLLIYEGMFGDDNKRARAQETGHSLFSEAAELAKSANVKRLWLTHYSPSLTEPSAYIDTTRNIFKDTECGFDGKSIDISFSD